MIYRRKQSLYNKENIPNSSVYQALRYSFKDRYNVKEYSKPVDMYQT